MCCVTVSYSFPSMSHIAQLQSEKIYFCTICVPIFENTHREACADVIQINLFLPNKNDARKKMFSSLVISENFFLISWMRKLSVEKFFNSKNLIAFHHRESLCLNKWKFRFCLKSFCGRFEFGMSSQILN